MTVCHQKITKTLEILVKRPTKAAPNQKKISHFHQFFTNDKKITSTHFSLFFSPQPHLTQTYDPTPSSFDTESETFQYPSEGRFANRGLRRSHSFATSSRFMEPSLSTPLHRSMSRQSFSSEFQASVKVNYKVFYNFFSSSVIAFFFCLHQKIKLNKILRMMKLKRNLFIS